MSNIESVQLYLLGISATRIIAKRQSDGLLLISDKNFDGSKVKSCLLDKHGQWHKRCLNLEEKYPCHYVYCAV